MFRWETPFQENLDLKIMIFTICFTREVFGYVGDKSTIMRISSFTSDMK